LAALLARGDARVPPPWRGRLPIARHLPWNRLAGRLD
jgi:hypothetical protein